MRRTTPDLVGQQKQIYRGVSIALLVLSIGYVLWTNYVVFVGGNLPLTSIHLSDGSTGGGLMMLLIGDLALLLVIWFVIDGVILNLLHVVLLKGAPRNRRTASAAPNQPPASWQGQPQQGQPQQWQPQQGQPQQWHGQPPQWQPPGPQQQQQQWN